MIIDEHSTYVAFKMHNYVEVMRYIQLTDESDGERQPIRTVEGSCQDLTRPQ
jgi:hypothetical protein